MEKLIRILYRNIRILVLMISCIKAENWKMPLATDIQNAWETCKVVDPTFAIMGETNLANNPNTDNIRCFSNELGLWNDDTGFNAKRLAKLLSKHQQNPEIIVVVTYCNDSTRQTNLSKWATDSYECFAQGRMGKWIENYKKHVYKYKSVNS